MEDVVWRLKVRMWSMDDRVWNLQEEVWSLENGVWSLEDGVWGMVNGVWAMKNGLWNDEETVEWSTEDRVQRLWMECGAWLKVWNLEECRLWRMSCGACRTDGWAWRMQCGLRKFSVGH